MLVAGDLNADPAVIPCLAGRYVDLALAHSLGAGLAPDNTCTFNRDDGSGSRRDFFIGCPGALAASHACYVTDRWFSPHFSLLARFRIGAWMADVACPVACQPLWPAFEDVVCALRDAASRSAVGDFWSIWSQNAEAALFRANRRLGGRAAGGRGYSRLYRVSQGDDVDVHCTQYFVHSSLSPVLLFRRRLKSVADVLKGIRDKGFTQTRWDALVGFWGLFVVMVHVDPFLLFILGTIGFPLICMVFIGGFLTLLSC